jgi:hypothetical protein
MRALLFRCATHLSALRDAAWNFFVERPSASTKTSDHQRRSTESSDREKREEGRGRPADFWD